MEIVTCSIDDERAAPVLAALHADYVRLYGPNDEVGRSPASDFAPPHGTFVVVRAGGGTVAGGGFRRFDDSTCEVKRVWAEPSRRRQGLATAVIESLTATATAMGYGRMILETGPLQPAAAALYDRLGFRRVPPFGPYPDDQGFELRLDDA